EILHCSGVLAVVAVGLYLGRQGPRIVASRTRLQARAVWEMLTFLLNGLLFILTGLQLRQILQSGAHFSLRAVLLDVVLILVTVIAVRFAWVFVNAYLPRMFRRGEERDPFPSWKPLFLGGWTGIRGSMSLVTALAIPLTLPGGKPFPSRDLIICIAFSVILAT